MSRNVYLFFLAYYAGFMPRAKKGGASRGFEGIALSRRRRSSDLNFKSDGGEGHGVEGDK